MFSSHEQNTSAICRCSITNKPVGVNQHRGHLDCVRARLLYRVSAPDEPLPSASAAIAVALSFPPQIQRLSVSEIFFFCSFLCRSHSKDFMSLYLLRPARSAVSRVHSHARRRRSSPRYAIADARARLRVLALLHSARKSRGCY